MTVRLVRFDEVLRVRAELNQNGIRSAGRDLLAAIARFVTSQPQMADSLQPLRNYALAGIAGQITAPRTWENEPLRYEFREDLLPEEILDAYGRFAFYTHGLTKTTPVVEYHDGQAYIAVDD